MGWIDFVLIIIMIKIIVIFYFFNFLLEFISRIPVLLVVDEQNKANKHGSSVQLI